MMYDTDRALFDTVRDHHWRDIVWWRIVGLRPVGRDSATFCWRLGEAQDGRVDKWLGSSRARSPIVLGSIVLCSIVLCSLMRRMNIFECCGRMVVLLRDNFKVRNGRGIDLVGWKMLAIPQKSDLKMSASGEGDQGQAVPFFRISCCSTTSATIPRRSCAGGGDLRVTMMVYPMNSEAMMRALDRKGV